MKACSPALALRRLAIPVAVALVVAAVLSTVAGCGGCGSGSPAASTTSTLRSMPPASPSPVTSPSSSSTPTASAPRQLVIAAASGPHANGISVIGSSGQVKQLVAPHGAPIRDLAWSPDGSRLAYVQATSADEEMSSVWIYDVATDEAHSLIDSYVSYMWGGPTVGYTWVGPSELVVAANSAASRFGHGNSQLLLVDVTGGTRTVMHDAGGHAVVGNRPTASADGTFIAFVRYGKATTENAIRTFREQLLVLDVVTGGIRQVAHGVSTSGPDSDAFSFPQISPDGSLIYTCQTSGDPGFGCTVYRTDGSRAYVNPRLTWPTAGSWLVGKGTLAFGGGALTTPISDAINVWLPGTSAATPIVTYPGGTGPIPSLTWTPHGKQIVYTVGDYGYPNGDIWIVNADGTNRHRLLHNGSYPACALAPISFR